MTDHNPNPYIVGGTVQAGNGLYIERAADQELLALCKAGTFAYVLTARQMGKSSLMVRTREALDAQGFTTAIVDLSGLGADKTQISGDQWYLGILVEMSDWLNLSIDVVTWWQARTHLSFAQRMVEYLEKVVLAEVKTQVVIFIDEIDSTLGLPFTDDFFAAIRAMHNMRATQPEFRRLGFVLVGVATPSDLIRDPQRTPFNIGQRVTLTDFTYDEAKPLAAGLKLPTEQADQILGWVLHWTGGHPYLTQRLFSIIASQARDGWSEAAVDSLVSETFFGPLSAQDNNLQFVRDMLTKRAVDRVGVLTAYRDVLDNKRPVPDEEQSLTKSHLKLSGVVRRSKEPKLFVSNTIYATVFNRRWINSYLPRPYGRIALGTSVVIVVVLIGIVGLLATKNNQLNADSTATAAAEIAFQSTSAQNATDVQIPIMSTQTQLAIIAHTQLAASVSTQTALIPTSAIENKTLDPSTISFQLTQCPGGQLSTVSISGFVQDAQTASPIIGTTITIMDTNVAKQVGTTQTGTQGEFAFSLKQLCLGQDSQANIVVTAEINDYISSSQTKLLRKFSNVPVEIQFSLAHVATKTTTQTASQSGISTLAATPATRIPLDVLAATVTARAGGTPGAGATDTPFYNGDMLLPPTMNVSFSEEFYDNSNNWPLYSKANVGVVQIADNKLQFALNPNSYMEVMAPGNAPSVTDFYFRTRVSYTVPTPWADTSFGVILHRSSTGYDFIDIRPGTCLFALNTYTVNTDAYQTLNFKNGCQTGSQLKSVTTFVLTVVGANNQFTVYVDNTKEVVLVDTAKVYTSGALGMYGLSSQANGYNISFSDIAIGN